MFALVLNLALLGFFAWMLVKFVPMPEVFRVVITAIVAIGAIVYLLQFLGYASGLRIHL